MSLNLNLIVDGNYILSRLVFTLHKNNLLYGALHQSLDNAISNYKKCSNNYEEDYYYLSGQISGLNHIISYATDLTTSLRTE